MVTRTRARIDFPIGSNLAIVRVWTALPELLLQWLTLLRRFALTVARAVPTSKSASQINQTTNPTS